jgi:hypothetical protein
MSKVFQRAGIQGSVSAASSIIVSKAAMITHNRHVAPILSEF